MHSAGHASHHFGLGVRDNLKMHAPARRAVAKRLHWAKSTDSPCAAKACGTTHAEPAAVVLVRSKSITYTPGKWVSVNCTIRRTGIRSGTDRRLPIGRLLRENFIREIHANNKVTSGTFCQFVGVHNGT